MTTATATRSAAEVLAEYAEAFNAVLTVEAEWDERYPADNFETLPAEYLERYNAACRRSGMANDAARVVLRSLLDGKPEETQVVSGGHAFRLTRYLVGFTPVVTVTDDTPTPDGA